MLWTKKGGLWLFLGVISLIFSLVTADFQFAILALIIFTFFLLVLILPRPVVSIDRGISNALLFENNELKVDLSVRKERIGYGTVEVYDKIPEFAELRRGINNMVYNPHNKPTLSYSLKFPLRGYYSLGPTHVRIADHFNLFYDDQILYDKQPVSVFPRISGLKEFKIKSKKNIHYPGEILTRQPGTSTEFYNIRDYIKGDPFKKINWKVYARKRELMVNEFEKENICDTVLFLDARSISNIGTTKDNSLEMGIKLALSVANFLILNRNQIGLIVYSDQVRVMPPKPGIQQRDKIVRFLTGVYPQGWAEFNVALHYARPYIKSKTTIIIISNLEYDLSFFSAMQELMANNHKILILTPSAIDFEVKAVDYKGPKEKIDIVKLSRENYMTQLRGLGIDVIEIFPEDTIEEIMSNVSKEILR